MAKKEMDKNQAEVIALSAFAWLAGEDERLMNFLALTGADASDLRSRAQDPEFLGFVLDFIMQDDEAILALSEETSMHPDDVRRARYYLDGGDAPEWT